MPNQRQRTFYIATAAILLTWALCWSGYVLARRSKMTAERVNQYANAMHLEKLSAAERFKKLHELVDRLNALSMEERRKWRFDQDLFRQLTDEEKDWFVDAVMPAEMHQALDDFEKLPKEERQKQIDDAIKELKAHSANAANRQPDVVLSPDLDKKVRTMGLKALYSGSSAQTKVELMPLLLEVQHQFESGRSLNDFQ
jgi:hypothetical protein